MKLEEKRPGENARMYAQRMILDNIINLELPPGSALSENELSLALRLSRTPVREALIEMGRLGLVEIIPQKGSFVTRIDYELIEESKFMRLSLENSVLRLICGQGISEESMERIRHCMAAQKTTAETCTDYGIMMQLDKEFHRLLFASVGKLRTHEFLQTQMVHFDRLRTLAYETLKKAKVDQMINDHENVLYALEKRDGELAEMVMTRHLTRHEIDKKELDNYCPDYFTQIVDM
ncbi:MAG: GntR family transcriptional regulator [Lachnospiraceae bacterium]|jgi:DNA-binding GntR family transcriptional regulator